MTTPICGHDRETLQWALSHEKRCGQFGGFDALRRGDDHCDAWRAIHDPAKLCDITTTLMRERGLDAYRRDHRSMQQIRALALALLDAPTTAIDVERILGALG